MRPSWVLLVATIVIFCGHFVMNTRGSIWNYEKTSEKLVTASLSRAYDEGLGVNHSGGFMFRGNRAGHAYTSQYGLQYRMIATIPWLAQHHSASRYVFGLLSALVLGTVVAAAYRELGPIPAGLTMLVLAASEPLAQFSMNLYWSMFLLFAPFAAACILYPKSGGGLRFLLFCLVIGLLIGAKSLCGYELLSCILASTLVPLVFYESRRGSRPMRIIMRAVAVMTAGVLGFAAAISIHLRSLAAHLGSWERCVEEVRHVILFRTVGEEGFQARNFLKGVMMFFGYFVNEHQAYYLIAAVAALYVWRQLLRMGGEDLALNRNYRSAVGLALLAFAASLSWNILAWGHMQHHLHVNYISFYLPFNIVAVLLCGCVISRVRDMSRRIGHA